MSIPTLEELGEQHEVIDRFILDLIKKRMDLGSYVIANKKKKKKSIYRHGTEKDRIKKARQYAESISSSPHFPDFATALIYIIIGESVKTQVREVEDDDPKFVLPADTKERNDKLLDNLLQLTEAIAPSYSTKNEDRFPATTACIKFEKEIICDLLNEIPHKTRVQAIDLGCATGQVSKWLAPHFDSVVGYDISQHMIREANKNKHADHTNITFEQFDLNEKIPCENETVSFVVMNFGTASDVKDVKRLFSEIDRVLSSEGKFFLSFYNADALIYKMGFLPWETGLAGHVDTKQNCLDVAFKKHIYKIHAQAYTLEEIQSAMPPSLVFTKHYTFPTVSSLIPSTIPNRDEMFKYLVDIDWELSKGKLGAYHLISGKKK